MVKRIISVFVWFFISIIILLSCSQSGPHQIDLMPAPDVYGEEAVNPFTDINPIENIGYKYRGEHGIPGRLYFTKGTDTITYFHLHMNEIHSKDWYEHITFRDYLIQHQEKAMEYSELKRKLAMKYERDRDNYLSEKSIFIQTILKAIENRINDP